MLEKWHHSEIHIAIDNESQGRIAKNLKYDELLYYTFISQSARELKGFLKLVNIWRSCRQKGDRFMRPVRVAYIEEAKNGNLGCATLRRRDILSAVHNYKIIPIRRHESNRFPF